jgi:hypothetical protein
MKEIIYNFLEESIGPGVKLKCQHDYYAVYSYNNTHIFSFRTKDDWEFIKLYRYPPLCRTIHLLFSVSEDEAAEIIKTWFGNKYKMKKVRDLRKFVHYI